LLGFVSARTNTNSSTKTGGNNSKYGSKFTTPEEGLEEANAKKIKVAVFQGNNHPIFSLKRK
jgi:hypothetical protein